MGTHPRDRSACRADAKLVAILTQGMDVWHTWQTDHSPDHTPEIRDWTRT
jgi:hypothetical protein